MVFRHHSITLILPIKKINKDNKFCSLDFLLKINGMQCSLLI